MGERLYWFEEKNVSRIDNEIKNIIESYEKIATTAMKVSTTMSEYINAPGKWNDDNSNVIAKWWNKDDNNNGMLKTDEEEGVKIVSSNNGLSNGEDRIRLILNQCSYLFWVVVCNPLVAVVKQQYGGLQGLLTPTMLKCMGAGNNDMSQKKPTSIEWDAFMQNFLTDNSKKFRTTILPTKNAKGGSNDTEINKFATDINKKLKLLDAAVQAFIVSIAPIINDDAGHQRFGVEPNNSKQVQNDLIKLTKTNLEDFKKNLETAVTNYSGMVSKQLAEYFATPFDGSY